MAGTGFPTTPEPFFSISNTEEQHMKSPSVHLIVCFIACSILILIPAMASSIQMEPSSITVQTGSSATINLTLDDAPSGLAGYDLVVRFSNPGVAEITDVTYPSWAVMYNTTYKSAGSVRISGIDISRQVEAGRTNIPLATLKTKGISGGTSSIIIESVYMDADGGSIITPTLPTGTITVTGTVVSSSGGNGGGSGYQVTSTTLTHTPAITQTQLTPTQTQVPYKEDTIPFTTQQTEQIFTVLTTTTVIPVSNEGIPFSWILGGIIIIGVLIIGAVIAWKWDKDHE
jgi:hypothetical protein